MVLGTERAEACRMTSKGANDTQVPSRPPWYALRVRSNFEKIASVALEQRGFEQFTPFYKAKRRWSDRVKLVEFPLFAGYVFCRIPYERRLAALQAPGVVSLVSFGGKPAPVDEREIEHLQTIVTSGREAMPWPYLRVGQKIRVRGGCLNGVEGLLLDLKNGRRIVVAVSLLQRAVAVEIDREIVEPVL